MKFQVKRGYANIEGVLYYKGSFFDADPDDAAVKSHVRRHIISPVKKADSEKQSPQKRDRDEP